MVSSYGHLVIPLMDMLMLDLYIGTKEGKTISSVGSLIQTFSRDRIINQIPWEGGDF